jgi:hypothetical protein
MKLMILVPALALAAALSATPALAATIQGVELTQSELNVVTQHCEHLAASEVAGDNSTNEATASAESDSTSATNSVTGETGAAGDLLAIDLDMVNLAVCKEAGVL